MLSEVNDMGDRGKFGGFDMAGPSKSSGVFHSSGPTGIFDAAGPSCPPSDFHTTFLSTGFDMAGPSRPSGVFHLSGPTGIDVAGPSGPPCGFHTTFLSTGFDIAGPSRSSSVFHPSGPTCLFDVAGPSGPSGGFHTTFLSTEFDTTRPSIGFGHTNLPPGSVDQGYQTPFSSNYQSFTDLLNDNRQQHVYDYHVRNAVSPVPFSSYSAEQNFESQYGDVSMSSKENNIDNDELGRGRRVRKPTDCGTR